MINQKERQWAAASYLGPMSLLILIAERDRWYVAHHARRATILFLVSIIVWVISSIRWLEYLVLAMMIAGFLSALMGEEFKLPILSEVADNRLDKKQFERYWSRMTQWMKSIIKAHSEPKK
ncbi:hypothetical protein IPJ72_03805 [Candidatus Peregrinibacteria bacterium]|nr:MAG: hypothetical protein IPJ72_03805 [Candidatus Peregrinibacteria bacterium]